MERKAMIEEIYEKAGHLYTDVRQYSSPLEIQHRRLQIQILLKRLSSLSPYRKTRTYRRLQRESMLLKYKYLLYTDSDELPTRYTQTAKLLMQSIDKSSSVYDDGEEDDDQETATQSNLFKRRQTEVLIHLMHQRSSDSEFRRYYEKMIESVV